MKRLLYILWYGWPMRVGWFIGAWVAPVFLWFELFGDKYNLSPHQWRTASGITYLAVAIVLLATSEKCIDKLREVNAEKWRA